MSCKDWLASVERRRCSNEAKKRNQLKFARVPQTNLSGRILDVYHTSTHGVVLGLKCAARGWLKIQDAKIAKMAICAPLHNFVGLYLRN